jgi:hypothetical protein
LPTRKKKMYTRVYSSKRPRTAGQRLVSSSVGTWLKFGAMTGPHFWSPDPTQSQLWEQKNFHQSTKWLGKSTEEEEERGREGSKSNKPEGWRREDREGR